jgi:hypothetical protein
MGIQSFTPSGGGGTPGFDYINSVNMITYNRTWAQAGAAGNYVLASYNKNSGYAYFVGSGVTTGIPLGYVAIVNHAFTSINIVAPTNDYISLFKASVKSTTVFSNALDNFASFPSIITASGNFVLPNNALPLINVLVAGGGGGASNHSGGGGGGGVVNLTAYQAVGTTSVTVGSGGSHSNSSGGGTSYFGNVYALGGGTSPEPNNTPGTGFANGGGYGFVGAHSGTTHGAFGTTQTASTGLGSVGSPTYNGGFRGAGLSGSFSPNHGGGGGGGAMGDGQLRTSTSAQNVGGAGYASTITGVTKYFGTGGGGGHHQTPAIDGSYVNSADYASGARSSASSQTSGQSGVVVVRYYIP